MPNSTIIQLAIQGGAVALFLVYIILDFKHRNNHEKHTQDIIADNSASNQALTDGINDLKELIKILLTRK